MEILTDNLTLLIGNFSLGYGRISGLIQNLIGILLAIELTLIGLWWAIGGGDQLVSILKKLLMMMFWLWFVSQFPTLSTTFVNSLAGSGAIAGGSNLLAIQPLMLDPSRIAGYGIMATAPMAAELSSITFDIGQAIFIGLSYIIMMFAYLAIACQVFLVVLEFYLIQALVGILLPFGLNKHTRFLAEKSIGAVISAGIKMMVLSFLIAVIDPVVQQQAADFAADPTLEWAEVWELILMTGTFAFLAWSAPKIAAGLLSGSPSLAVDGAYRATAHATDTMSRTTANLVSSTRAAASAGNSIASKSGHVLARTAGAMSASAGLAYHAGRAAGGGPIGSAVVGAASTIKPAAASLVQSAYDSRAGMKAQRVVESYKHGKNDVLEKNELEKIR